MTLAYSGFPLMTPGRGIFSLRLDPSYGAPQRIFFLPELEHVDVPADLSLTNRLDEERWLGGPLLSGHVELIELRKGERRRLFPRPAGVEHIDRDDGVIELLEVPPCCVEGDWNDEGPLWRVPIDGGEPELLVERMSRRMSRLADGRRLGPVEIDGQSLGALVLVDPETGAELRLDERVVAPSLSFARLEEDELVTYSVSDGERSGVYLAKVPASRRSGVVKRAHGGEPAFVVEVAADAEGRVSRRLREVDGGEWEHMSSGTGFSAGAPR